MIRGMQTLPSEPNGPIRVRWGHRGHRVEAVTLLSGEVVRYLCVDCDEVLPLNYDCDDCMWVEVTQLGDDREMFVLGKPCSAHSGRRY